MIKPPANAFKYKVDFVSYSGWKKMESRYLINK